MNSHPGVNETLALLDTLKNVIRDFAAREEKLNGEFRIATAAALSAFETRSQEQEAAAISATERGRGAGRGKRPVPPAVFDGARRGSTARTPPSAGRCWAKSASRTRNGKTARQQGVQEAEQRREADLASATSAYEQFPAEPGRRRRRADQLETEASGAFRGYGKFRRLLAPEPNGRSRICRRMKTRYSPSCSGCKQKSPAIWTGSEIACCRCFSDFFRSGS